MLVRTFYAIAVVCFVASCASNVKLDTTSFDEPQALIQKCPTRLPNVGDDLCGIYSVPLNWHAPSAEKIEVFLRSFPLNGNARGQLWVIDGGPGASGATFSDPMFVELIHDMGWDLYIHTHRGVGLSTPIECTIKYLPLDDWYADTCSSELSSNYGTNTNWFGAVGAAYDLHHLIQANNSNNMPVVVMGTSYGTFVTQRFIQLFESTIDSAILLSGTVLNPQFEIVADEQEQTFKRILAKCNDQINCAGMFEETAYEVLTHFIHQDGWKNCEFTKTNQNLTSYIITSLASNATLIADLPITIKRLVECTKTDIAHLQQTLTSIQMSQQRQREQLHQFNPLMLHHQILTELMSRNAIDKSNVLPERPLLMSPIETYISVQSKWLNNTSPILLPNGIDTDLPVLALHGALDMQAPLVWFETLQTQLDKRNQHTILFSEAGHGTPNYTKLEDDQNCTWMIVKNFLNNKNQLNTSCVEALKPLIFKHE